MVIRLRGQVSRSASGGCGVPWEKLLSSVDIGELRAMVDGNIGLVAEDIGNIGRTETLPMSQSLDSELTPVAITTRS